ncbi:hypothetical protein CTEN210_09651 [Chaetoceros tenuissimus]|uniref:MYND-type domain-containing protein n=1 Tax=Chaetoceros tenuissimus TaxID=426638 RepID=A0AAD3CY72_9STRA|nr:hypothetical protein CTEN210_09651 [Chaetoceros tenuissimus]
MSNPTALQLKTDLEKGLVLDGNEEDDILRITQKAGQPPFSTQLLVSINQYIHNQGEYVEERFKLDLTEQLKDVEVGERDSCTLHVLYSTMKNICTKASKELLQEAVTDTEMRIIFNHFVQMLKYAISRENKGVIIDEEFLYEAVALVSVLFESLNPSHEIIQEYLKSLASTAKRATVVPAQDSGVGYFLCESLIQCYVYSVTKNSTSKIASVEKKFMMMHKTGMLEQVLRHIHLPWTIADDNDSKERVRLFFITMASSSISLSKVFKAGSPSRDALVDILEGRIKPCAENEHVMEILEALKKFLDMGLTSGNPDDRFISMKNIECAKCGKQDFLQKLLVCGSCKYVRYCSRECQAADWKRHKHACKRRTSSLKNRSKNENCEAIAEKFLAEHRNSIYETMRKCYDGGDLVLDLNFSNDCAPELPPAFRNPPEFEVFPADIFWNREKDKAPAGHWFFEDLGGGTTCFSDGFINKVRKDVEVDPDDFNLFVFLKLSDSPGIYKNVIPRAAMKENYNESEEIRKSERYQQERSKFIQRFSDESQLSQLPNPVVKDFMSLLTNPEGKDLSASEKQEHVKNSLGNFFDMLQDISNEIII